MSKRNTKPTSKTDKAMSISQRKAIEMGEILMNSNLAQIEKYLNR
jgi:hypothetical protein